MKNMSKITAIAQTGLHYSKYIYD
ncbi:NUDIX hydrolase N-terminal domain-containing protein, partial [Acinetobacter lactucae]|nr:NUDIX hydrolase N-terminal domain-containing protein [Acinetobacter lactucae]